MMDEITKAKINDVISSVSLKKLEPEKVVPAILESIPQEVKGEVIQSIANMDWKSPETIREIERILKEWLDSSDDDIDLVAYL